jgi:phage shock protein C
MFCTQCGTHLSDDARFCTVCGKPTLAGTVAPSIYAIDAPARRLYRIRSRKKIAGVCAGFAEYFGLDVTLVRLIWVGLLIMPPSIGLIGYIISWIVLPTEQDT